MDFADRFVTVANPLKAFTEAYTDLIGAKLVAQMIGSFSTDPIVVPVRGWSLDALLRHLNEFLLEIAAAVEEPGVAETLDVEEFHSGAMRVYRAFHRPHYVGERRPTPLGVQPGSVMIQYVINELVAHSWDFTTAINRRNRLPDWLAERCLLSWQVFFETFGRPAEHFDPERPPPPNPTVLTRLAAYLGREVPDTPVVLWRDPELIALDLKRIRDGARNRARARRRHEEHVSRDAMVVRFSELPPDSVVHPSSLPTSGSRHR